MIDYRANQLTYPELTSFEGVLACFKSGEIGKVRGDLIYTEDVFKWDIPALRANFGDKKLSTHKNFTGKKFEYAEEDLAAFIDRLSAVATEDMKTMRAVDKNQLYGVVNAKKLSGMRTIKKEVMKNFRHCLNYVWVGMSPGEMHCDYMDNTLLQLSGSKRIIVFPASVADDISEDHYTNLPNKDEFFSKENFEACSWLGRLPYYDVTIQPGEAVVLPNRAYHVPMALTNDSVSINSFFTPRNGKNLSSVYARKEQDYPWWLTNAAISVAQMIYSVSGKIMLRVGHYEVL